jgi:hypothetical protein
MSQKLEKGLAKLHKDVVFQKANGKIIWQPRIACWYHDKLFAGEQLPDPYQGMDIFDIYRDLGCSARLYEKFNLCFKEIEHPQVKITEKQLNNTDFETLIETPVGNQRAINRKTKTCERPIRIKWEISDEQELKVAIWRLENSSWQWHQKTYDTLVEQYCDLGAPTMFLPRVTIQDLYINRMGVEKAMYALMDYPSIVEAYFKALDEHHDRMMEIINDCPIDIINFGDNLHCSTLPPHYFTKYVLPSYNRRCEKLHSAGKFVSSHWDGDVKTLLPLAKETQLDAVEAVTPFPQGDVTLEETKDALGDDIFLLDGIPAVLFNDYHSVEELIECTKKIIDLFAPKLVLGISDELSSTGDIQRIKVVNEIVQEYNSGK